MVATPYSTLRDAEATPNARAEAIIALLPSIANMVHFRSTLEREYGNKLREGVAKARAAHLKDTASRTGNGNRTNSLENSYLQYLYATEANAKERIVFADSLAKEATSLEETGIRQEAIRKKHHSFNAKLIAQRDATVQQRESSKKKYFEACTNLESARAKKAAITDERQSEKANTSYAHSLAEMYQRKNQFLLDTTAANAVKSHLYATDLPRLLDDLQLLESTAIRSLFAGLERTVGMEKESLGRLGGLVEGGMKALGEVDIERDQNEFVEAQSANLGAWSLPPDLGWEESPVWHDSNEINIEPTPAIVLANLKLKESSKLGELGPQIEKKSREIAGLRNLRDAYENDRSLGDVTSVLENLFESGRELSALENAHTDARSRVDLISSALPEESGPPPTPHTFKSASFVTPSTCRVCETTLWGKAMSCKLCGSAVHTKCELLVPADCGNGSTTTTRRPLSHSSSTSISTTTQPRPLATPLPTRGQSYTTAPPTSVVQSSIPARVLYDYTATTGFELTVHIDEEVIIVEEEDGEGWCKVTTDDGRRGLVPASYLRVGGGGGEVRRVIAIYDYEATESGELTIHEGEEIELTALGEDFGEGWTEATKGGIVGIIPTSYTRPA